MVTAVSAQPAEPIVSTGSLPSASRDHASERWLKVGTGVAAVTDSPPSDQATAASVAATSARRHPLCTAPSYGRAWAVSSAGDVGFKSLPLGDSRPSTEQAGQVAFIAGKGQAGVEHIVGIDGRPKAVSWLISNLDGWGCRRLGGE